MKNYIVHVKEVWDQPVRVEAENEEEAIVKVSNGKGPFSDIAEYDCDLDIDQWVVEEEPDPRLKHGVMSSSL